eukprot:8798143-Alexandrium_andersonii.AAC.1
MPTAQLWPALRVGWPPLPLAPGSAPLPWWRFNLASPSHSHGASPLRYASGETGGFGRRRSCRSWAPPFWPTVL